MRTETDLKKQTGIHWLLTILCVLLWLERTVSAAGQGIPLVWQPLGGPVGRISHLVAAPGGTQLYAATATAVARRDDQTQWRDSGNLYRGDALYHSTDDGITWHPLTNDLPPGAITALYVDPVTDNLLVAVQSSGDVSTRRYGLWRSSDLGAHWDRMVLGRDDLNVWSIARSADGHYLYLGVTEAVKDPSSLIYRSDDNGRTWTSFQALRYEQRPGSLLVDLISHPTITDTLFITTLGGELYISDDAGETWSLPGKPETPPQPGWTGPARLAIRPDQPRSLLLVRQRGGLNPAPWLVESSSDDGVTWTSLPATGLEPGGTPRALVALPDGVFLLNTGTATYRSVDGGNTWQHLEGPLSSGGVSEFLVLSGSRGTGSTVLAATGFGPFISQDGGALWSPLGTGLPFNSKIAGLLTDSRQPERVYAVPDNQPLWDLASPPQVLRSLDGGRTWAPASRDLPGVYLMAWMLAPDDPNRLYLASYEHFFRSTDGGLSWRTYGVASGAHSAITVAPSRPRTIYLTGLPVLRSTDDGATWTEMPIVVPGQERQISETTGLVVDPADPAHIWAALNGAGVVQTTDGGTTWSPAGLEGRRVRWLLGDPAGGSDRRDVRLYAGLPEDGIYRWDGQIWTSASAGLPISSTILSMIADDRMPGTLWAGRDGGGIYRSTDYGTSWVNAGADIGENLVQAMALDYTIPNGLFIGTATAGIWALRPGTSPGTVPNVTAGPGPGETGPQPGVDARIEILWPHGGVGVNQARLANIGLRLFQPYSLLPPACNWSPKVTVWQAVDTNPAEPLGEAKQRTVDSRPFPYWELNDIDVSQAIDPEHKLYFMVRVAGVETATSVWAHGADPRTYFPHQDVPSGTAIGSVDAVDARIQVVWPHDETGVGRSVAEGTLANVAVAFFKHGTRLSVPVDWQPGRMTLYGAWNWEVGRPLGREALMQTRQAGAITYPIWEFNNIPVARAANPENKLYLWVIVDSVETYPNIWTHGADARTFFPAKDEPVQGCVP